MDIEIEMKPVSSLPKQAKKGKQGSKYDGTLRKFLRGTNKIVEVSQKDVDGKTLSSGFKQRIKNNLEFSGIMVVSRIIEGKTLVYLQKK